MVRLARACDAGCPFCEATGPAPTTDPRSALAGGGRRLTLRGPAVEARRLARAAEGWGEVALHTHGLRGDAGAFARGLGADGIDAVLVPLFSHVAAVHDRVLGRRGALDRARATLTAAGDAGLKVDVEVPLLPRRLAHPRSILRRAREATGTLRAVRFVLAKTRVPPAIAPPRWDEGADLLAEALAWCAEAGVEARLARDQAIPFCALREHEALLGSAFRFDPRRAREPVRGCARPAPCDACACRAQCPGVSTAYRDAHGTAGIVPFARRPAALYHQRTTPKRRWTEREKDAARRTGLLVLRPTVNCNQDCVFCSANETSENVWTSSDAMLKQIVRAARRGVTRVAFGGGEPTLTKDLSVYVRAARRLGIEEVELVTNGTLLDRPARVDALAEAGLTHAFVSLHAHDEKLSRHLTQKLGDFERTVRATALLADAGVKTAVNHVVTARNHRYLPELVRFVRERFGGRVAISFAFVTPQYKALEHMELMPRMSEVVPHLKSALALAMELGQPCWVGARQGIPPCQLGAFRAWSDILEHADAGLAQDAPQKVRADACDRCRYTEVCTGVWRPYAARYGLDELRPIEGPPLGAAERAAMAALETEPWGLPPASFERLPDFLRDRDDEAALAARADRAPAPLPEDRFAPVRTRPLRVALLGSGRRARRLAGTIRAIEGLSLDAVASPHAPDGDLDDFGRCPVWRDAATALDEMRPDAVIVAAATTTHDALVRLALERGAPVLCARPLARTLREAEALVARAEDAGVPLVVAYDPLGLPALDAVGDAGSVRVVQTVGRAAPRAWGRRALTPWLHDGLALASRWLGDGAALARVDFRGESRPTLVRARFEGEVRSVELSLELGREDGWRVHAADTRAWPSADPRATLERFGAVALGRAEPGGPALDGRRALAIATRVAAVLDALEAAGAPLERATEPKHVASRALR